MRALLLSTVALATLAGSAFAADLPSRKEAPVYIAPAPAFSWTGFYIGGDIGAAFTSTSVSGTGLAAYEYATHGLLPGSLSSSGFMGGGYVGYNYQLNQNFVLGLEGDFQGTSNSKSYTANYDGAIFTTKASLDWLAAINGRLGVAYDRALFYAIGGVAWAGANGSFSATDGAEWLGYSNSTTLSGFDVGAGVEYAFTPNWVGRVEYRYYDFGNTNLNSSLYYDELPGLRLNTSVNTVRVGLAYLFSSPAPVVAKY